MTDVKWPMKNVHRQLNFQLRFTINQKHQFSKKNRRRSLQTRPSDHRFVRSNWWVMEEESDGNIFSKSTAAVCFINLNHFHLINFEQKNDERKVKEKEKRETITPINFLSTFYVFFFRPINCEIFWVIGVHKEKADGEGNQIFSKAIRLFGWVENEGNCCEASFSFTIHFLICLFHYSAMET